MYSHPNVTGQKYFENVTRMQPTWQLKEAGAIFYKCQRPHVGAVSSSVSLVIALSLRSSEILHSGVIGFSNFWVSWWLNFLGKMKEIVGNPLHLTSLNHISLVCSSVEESINFYQNVLGFVPIRRPDSFDFNGAW